MQIIKANLKCLLLVLICFQIMSMCSMALGDEIKVQRNKQGENVAIRFDNTGHFAGFVAQLVVEKYGGEPIEIPIVYNGTSKGEVTFYDQKGNLLQDRIISFKGDKDEITLSDGTELKRNKRGERIGLCFDGNGRLVRFVAQTLNPKLERSIDYLFISELKPRPF